jgi:hypothetical protein
MAHAGGGLRLTVLGPVRAWRDGTELELGPPQQRALLAVLLAGAGEPVTVEEIVDVLWRQDPRRGGRSRACGCWWRPERRQHGLGQDAGQMTHIPTCIWISAHGRISAPRWGGEVKCVVW